jgi:hypothetical protein
MQSQRQKVSSRWRKDKAMESRRPYCFVRTWSHWPVGEKDDPRLHVTYRLALETFASYADYELKYYDQQARHCVRRIIMGESTLQIQLRSDRNVLVNSSHKRVTHFKVSRINHHILVITVSVVYFLTAAEAVSSQTTLGNAWSDQVDFIWNAQCRPRSDRVLAIEFNRCALTDADHYNSTCFAPRFL